MRGQRTIKELGEVVGVHPRTACRLLPYCEAFRLAGCARIVGWRRRNSPIYDWQPSLFALPDVAWSPSVAAIKAAHKRAAFARRASGDGLSPVAYNKHGWLTEVPCGGG